MLSLFAGNRIIESLKTSKYRAVLWVRSSKFYGSQLLMLILKWLMPFMGLIGYCLLVTLCLYVHLFMYLSLLYLCESLT